MHQVLDKSYLKEIVDFMFKCNDDERQYIPFCAKKKESILKDTKELLDDSESKVVARIEEGKIMSLMALDVEEERGRAEVVAFFINVENEEVWQEEADGLMHCMKSEASKVKQYVFYVGGQNVRIQKFLERHKVCFRGDEYTLSITNIQYTQMDAIERLTKEDETSCKAFIALHDKLFQGAYYEGKGIIERIDEDNQVFIQKKNGCLVGYCYAEREEDVQWGCIHFLGVDENWRKQGIGRCLVSVATQWVLEGDVKKVSMTVDCVNEKALELYKKIGYKITCLNKAYHYDIE
ncbi:MAG: GNAT family N-acetyltransferase [Cellulosilyticaceae bacterium]